MKNDVKSQEPMRTSQEPTRTSQKPIRNVVYSDAWHG